MKIVIKKDDDGFLAEVQGIGNLFAWGKTEEEAKRELANVIEMTIDIYLEQVAKAKEAQSTLVKNHAVQV